jgi:glycosyltransferase involved in cell wall biosynthesis
MKIAIVSCYDQIDYIRALTLREAFASVKDVQPIVVKNRQKGLLRYLEVPLRILQCKFRERPDAWVIVFRGYEMLPFLLTVKGRAPLIFDEFINPVEYMEEHDWPIIKGWPKQLFLWWYRGLLRRCKFVLVDTQAHVDYSASRTKLDFAKYIAMPIGTDEKLFHPKAATHKPGKTFRVFYYGVMKRLYGLQYFLDAAVMLGKTHPHVAFTISDPRGDQAPAIEAAVAKGANIKIHSGWIPFETLPKRMIESDLTVGGPFGNTLQGQFAIATKTFQGLACAVPTLVGKNQATKEGFVDKQNCLLVPQGDAKAVAKAIGWAADHPKKLQAIGKDGRKLFEARFSNQVITKKVQQLVGALR